MPPVAEGLLRVCPVVTAALLLVARTLCEALSLPAPTVGQILAATKAPHSSAYDLTETLVALLPTLVPVRGRPPAPAPAPTAADGAPTRAVLEYVMAHPGCVHRVGTRRHYADCFRRFVVELRAGHATLDLAAFADAVGVPPGTLKEWLGIPAQSAEAPAAPPRPAAEGAQMQTVLDAWPRWAGGFLAFCDHVRDELRVPFGRALVARILEVHGLRRPVRRDGRSPDEIALRGAFRTYFPGAQWVGDGMQVPVVVDGERFVFNLELDVDAHTSALVGVCVGDEEDSTAVVEALADAVATTGAPPLALLLDNKPANHAPEVDAALGDTLRIRATLGRPQNKAHVEGAFGLFSQILPALELDTMTCAHDVARALLGLVVPVWARTTNHRPRADRGGRSRVDLYADTPSDAQIVLALT